MQLGHTIFKYDQPDPSQNTDSGFDSIDTAGGDDNTHRR